MTEDSRAPRLLPRWFAALMFMAHLGWLWAAPALHERRGDADEAAWLPLFLAPTTLVGLAMAVVMFAKPTRLYVAIFLVVFALHLAVGLGLHPR